MSRRLLVLVCSAVLVTHSCMDLISARHARTAARMRTFTRLYKALLRSMEKPLRQRALFSRIRGDLTGITRERINSEMIDNSGF